MFAIFLAIVIAIGGSALWYFGSKENAKIDGREATAELFENHLVAPKQEMNSTGSCQNRDNYIEGKALAVGTVFPRVNWFGSKRWSADGSRPYVDDLHFKLPEEIRATNPDEVETIIRIIWDFSVHGRYTNGRYTNGREAIQLIALVDVYDQANQSWVSCDRFFGEEPRDSIRGTQEAYGKPPFDQIVDFINQLPRR